MCLTTEALAVFLNLIIASSGMTMSEDRIIVHATDRDAHWVLTDGEWCTLAPQIDRIERFAALRLEAE
jgi:hypothetical protein